MPKQVNPERHDKPCTICGTSRQILIRCQVDETGKWHFVCPGKCWKDVSGGIEDAKGLESKYPFYRYGGMWKNKHSDGPISAKKPRKVKERQKKEAQDRAAGGNSKGMSTDEDENVEIGAEIEVSAVTQPNDDGTVSGSPQGVV